MLHEGSTVEFKRLVPLFDEVLNQLLRLYDASHSCIADLQSDNRPMLRQEPIHAE